MSTSPSTTNIAFECPAIVLGQVVGWPFKLFLPFCCLMSHDNGWGSGNNWHFTLDVINFSRGQNWGVSGGLSLSILGGVFSVKSPFFLRLKSLGLTQMLLLLHVVLYSWDLAWNYFYGEQNITMMDVDGWKPINCQFFQIVIIRHTKLNLFKFSNHVRTIANFHLI
jgi:hypothetical protein